MTPAPRGKRALASLAAAWVALALSAGLPQRAAAQAMRAVRAESNAAPSSPAPSLSAARVTAQVAAGTLAAPVAFFGGGIVTKRAARALGAGDDLESRAAYVGAYTSTWLATAAVPAAIGRDGKFGAALAGSALGLLASVGTVQLGNWLYDADRRPCGVVCWTLGAAVAALPGIGATIAYDQSRR